MRLLLALLLFAQAAFAQNVSIGTKNTTVKDAGTATFATGTFCIKDLSDSDKACFAPQAMSGNITITLPAVTGTLATLADIAAGGYGDMSGPSSATDGAFALFDGTTGKLVKNSSAHGTGVMTFLAAPTGANLMTALGCSGTTDFLRADGACAAPTGTGDVVGPASSTDGRAAVFDSTTGKLLKQFSPTAGSILFAGASGILAQDNSGLFYDDTNDRLGIGTTAPDWRVHVKRTAAGSADADYPRVQLEYTDESTTTGTFSAASFKLFTGAGLMGSFSAHNTQYNGGVAIGVFKPSMLIVQARDAASNGLLITTKLSSAPILLATNHGTLGAAVGLYNFTDTGAYMGANSTPSATVHIKAGSTSAGSAPIKLTSGSLMSSAEAGAVEFLTDKPYFTITTGTARKEFTLNDAALTSGRVPFATTNGRLTDSANFTFDGTRLNLNSATGTGTRYFYNSVSLDGTAVIMSENTSSGTAAQTNIVARNGSGNAGFSFNGTGYTTVGIRAASDVAFLNLVSGGTVTLSATSAAIQMSVDGATTSKLTIDTSANVVVGSAAIATNATDGFLYMPCSAGPPTGTPTAKTGRAPITCDSSNNKAYMYLGGAWQALN